MPRTPGAAGIQAGRRGGDRAGRHVGRVDAVELRDLGPALGDQVGQRQ